MQTSDTHTDGSETVVAERLIDLAIDFARSLWAELGAIEHPRRHTVAPIDLEQLIAFTGVLADADEELDDAISQWCAENNRYVSEVRLRNLERDFGWRRHPSMERSFGKARFSELRLDRPALLSLRLRALFGTGARAEVIGYLLAARGGGVPLTLIMREVCYSKQAVLDAMTGLVATGLVSRERWQNRFGYMLEKPDLIAKLIGPVPDRFIRWRSLFRMMGTLLDELDRTTDDIDALFLAERIERDADFAGFDSPRTLQSGSKLAWMRDWSVDAFTKIARGDTDLFGTA